MKICLFDGCTNPVYSHLFCKYHQNKRTDRKAMETKNKAVQPRSPINPYKRTTPDKSELKTTKKELLFSFGFNNQKEMFDFVWLTRPHICQISGSNLDLVPKDRRHWCCAHILNKKNYPFYKLNSENILLVHPDVHYCVDNFTEDMRKKYDYNFDLWFDLVNFMKQKYLEFLKENMI